MEGPWFPESSCGKKLPLTLSEREINVYYVKLLKTRDVLEWLALS